MAPWVSFVAGLMLSAAMPVAAQLQTPQQRGCIVAVNKADLEPFSEHLVKCGWRARWFR
jgi:hypothetical protein